MDFQAISEAIVLHPWLAAAPLSVLLQIVALIWLKGILRSINVILAAITGAVIGLAVVAHIFDPGNLWQLLLMLAAPPLLVLTTGSLLIGIVVRPILARPGVRLKRSMREPTLRDNGEDLNLQPSG